MILRIMQRLMTFERYDVVIAPFPFVDLPVRKARPVLVLSSASFNRTHGQFVGGMITSAARSAWATDHAIQDLAAAGLPQPAVLRWKLFTLPASLVSRRIGALSPGDRAALALRVAEILLA